MPDVPPPAPDYRTSMRVRYPAPVIDRAVRSDRRTEGTLWTRHEMRERTVEGNGR